MRNNIQMPRPAKDPDKRRADGCGLLAYPTAEMALRHAESYAEDLATVEAYECIRGWIHLRSVKNAHMS